MRGLSFAALMLVAGSVAAQVKVAYVGEISGPLAPDITSTTTHAIVPVALATTTQATPSSGISISVPAATSTARYQFTRNLSLHMKGDDVLQLQKYLNAHGFVIAKTGVGSPGSETNLFGLRTYAALVKFQEVHAKEILTPSGLTKGTGYFGAGTRAFANRN